MSKGKLDEQPANAGISVSEALNKEYQYAREAAFQRWLKSEKKVSVGMFTRKRLIKMQNGVKNGNIDSKHSRKRENIKHGITFDEWKRWKNEQRITTEQENSKQEKESITDDDNTKKRNQNTFEKWLQKKNELKKAEDALRTTIEAQSEAKGRCLKQSNLNDPRR